VHLVEIDDASLVSREGVLLREVKSYPFIPATPVAATEL
jgi:hypothetical protein